MDESAYKSKYYLQAVKKKSNGDRLKSNLNDSSKRNDKNFTDRNYSQIEAKNKTIKRLHLNEELRKNYCYSSKGHKKWFVIKI